MQKVPEQRSGLGSEGVPAEPVRVLIVDDHVLFAQALQRVLDDDPQLNVVGTGTTLAEGLQLLERSAVEVVLLDYRLPDVNGVDGVALIRELSPLASVVMVTASEDERLLLRAIEAGCAGFVTKTADIREVREAIHRAAAGEASISPPLLAQLLRRLARATTGIGNDLTDRERDVVVRIGRGLTNAEIAGELVLSVNTVRNHVQSVLTKLGAHSKLEAAAIAVREGLLQASG